MYLKEKNPLRLEIHRRGYRENAYVRSPFTAALYIYAFRNEVNPYNRRCGNEFSYADFIGRTTAAFIWPHVAHNTQRCVFFFSFSSEPFFLCLYHPIRRVFFEKMILYTLGAVEFYDSCMCIFIFERL